MEFEKAFDKGGKGKLPESLWGKYSVSLWCSKIAQVVTTIRGEIDDPNL